MPPVAFFLSPLRWIIALSLGLALVACSGKQEPTATTGPAQTATGPNAAEKAANAAAAAQAAALAALTDDELKKRGSQALREQRLYAPAGNNAMEYYIALRKKNEKPNASAESALMDLQPYAVIAAEQALGREDFLEADRLRRLIAEADPQAPALNRIINAIAKGKLVAAQRTVQDAARAQQQAEAAQTSASAEPAPLPVQPTAVASPALNNQANTEPTPVSPAQVVAPPPAAPVAAPVRRPTGLVPISTPQPAYPPDALRSGTNGEVVLTFTVNTQGNVENMDVVSSKPRGVFERTVQSAVRRWKFQPIDSPQTITRTFTFSR